LASVIAFERAHRAKGLENRLSLDSTVERLKKSIINGNEEDAENAASEILQSGIDPMLAMERELFPT
jgi:methanogenic corrinoid protein MtbC1